MTDTASAAAPRIALLSHRGGNIGHDFMSYGAEEIVRTAFGEQAEIVHYEQHRPSDIYPLGHCLRLADVLDGDAADKIMRWACGPDMQAFWKDALPMRYDLAVACGGPNLVPGAHATPRMSFLLHHLNGSFAAQGVPLIDAGVGSCFPLEKPVQLVGPDIAFYRAMLGHSALTTVRDTVAQDLFARLGHETPHLPCMAIAGGRTFMGEASFAEAAAEAAADGGHIVFNIQPRGANEDWGQGVDVRRWLGVVAETVAALRQDHRIVFLAHAFPEMQTAEAVAPDLPRFMPQTKADYARVLGGAKCGLVNRIHAAIPLAGCGVPSVVVGNDTRLLAVATIGLQTHFAKTVTADALIAQIRGLLEKREEERARLLALRENTIARYAALFSRYAVKRS
jgi:hypothetical protein